MTNRGQPPILAYFFWLFVLSGSANGQRGLAVAEFVFDFAEERVAVERFP